MTLSLLKAEELIKERKTLVEFTVTQVGPELHLAKHDVCFARLIPAEDSNQWRIEYFHNEKRWESLDFTGSLEECLDLLANSPHYRFWER
ncbi:MAG: hypothetical protein JRE16_03960 [Deltaproteobacteria bacterium]|nr:hypothetical protein [Deltaproteobacteria bacterium]MBW2477841.1 hypothetical protein [Deltaproteobacteria bacterium]MBW2503708.1 hypothetical protein [Deltaproteobacteria bacterium]MBW2519529.1 hypothetical protein [Deltaproteobacteria bacterium]